MCIRDRSGIDLLRHRGTAHRVLALSFSSRPGFGCCTVLLVGVEMSFLTIVSEDSQEKIGALSIVPCIGVGGGGKRLGGGV